MIVFWVTAGLFFICLIGESITSYMFIRGSRKKHPVLWEHAGEPTLMGNGDLINAFPLVEYVRRRDYSEIFDVEAIQFADKLREPLVYSYWIAVASAVVFIGGIAITYLVG